MYWKIWMLTPLIYLSTSPTGSENHLASFRFQNTFLLNVWNRNGDRWFSDPVGEVLYLQNIVFLNLWKRQLSTATWWKSYLHHGPLSSYLSFTVLHQLDQKIIYPHYDFKHLTEKYFEIGMKLDDFLIQLVKYCLGTFFWIITHNSSDFYLVKSIFFIFTSCTFSHCSVALDEQLFTVTGCTQNIGNIL